MFFLAGIILIITSVVLSRPDEEELNVKTTASKEISYQPSELSEATEVSEQFLDYLETGRNPFISPVKLVKSEAQLESPPPIPKPLFFNLFSPLPDENHYNAFTFLLPLKNDPPDATTYNLLASDDIKQLIDATKPKETVEDKKPDDPFPDTITLWDNTVLKGKIVRKDETSIVFQKEGDTITITYDLKALRNVNEHMTIEQKYLKRKSEINDADATAHVELARWCMEEKLISQALFEINRAIKIDATQLDYYLLAAGLYRRVMDTENEMKLYKGALNTSLVKKEAIYLQMGELYEKLNRMPEAIEAYNSAVKAAPNQITPLVKLGRMYYQCGYYEQLETAYSNASRISTRDTDVALLEGMLLFKKGELSKAEERLNEILDDNSGEEEWKLEFHKDEIYSTLGVINVLQKNYNNASKYFYAAIENAPYKASGWINLAALYLMSRDYTTAEWLIKESMERAPVSAMPYLAGAYALWGQNKTDNALKSLQDASKMETDNILINFALGQFYFSKGDFSQAQKIFSEIIKRKPLIPACLYYLGLCSFYANNFPEAAIYFKVYLTKLANEKPSPADYSMTGIAYLSAKQTNTARFWFDQALAINPQFAPALNGIGYIEYLSKNTENAINQFKKVLALYPNDAYASASLTAIEEAETQVAWPDPFDRPDNTTVGEGWTEHDENYNVEIEIFNRQLKFSGIQKNTVNGVSYIERISAANALVRFDCELNIKEMNRGGAGIFLAAKDSASGAKQGVLFYGIFLSGNKYRLGWQASGSADVVSDKWNEIPVAELPNDYLKLSIRKATGSDKQLELKLLLNDVVVASIVSSKIPSVSRAKIFALGIYGYAPIGTTWELLADSVKVIEKR